LTLGEKFEKVADAVFAKGMEEGNQSGYESAYSSQLVKYETMFSGNGTRTNFCGAFCGSDWTGYTFAHPLYPKSSIERMFNAYAGTELPKGIDCSQLDCTKSATYYRFAFEWAIKLKKIPDIGIPAIPYYQNTYANCKELVEIEVIRCNRNTVFQNPFINSPNITTFRIEGEIGTNFDCSQISPNPNTMMSVLQRLVDYSGTTSAFKYSVLFPSDCWRNLNETIPAPGVGYWEDYVEAKGWLF
jgi:hypothetical protein